MVLNVINARLVDYVGILDNGCKHLRNTSLKAFTTEQQKYFRFLSAYFLVNVLRSGSMFKYAQKMNGPKKSMIGRALLGQEFRLNTFQQFFLKCSGLSTY